MTHKNQKYSALATGNSRGNAPVLTRIIKVLPFNNVLRLMGSAIKIFTPF